MASFLYICTVLYGWKWLERNEKIKCNITRDMWAFGPFSSNYPLPPAHASSLRMPREKNVRLTPSMNLSSIATPDYGKMCPNFWFLEFQFNQLPITGLDLVSFGSFSMSLVQCLKFIIGASWTFFFSWHSQWRGVTFRYLCLKQMIDILPRPRKNLKKER